MSFFKSITQAIARGASSLFKTIVGLPGKLISQLVQTQFIDIAPPQPEVSVIENLPIVSVRNVGRFSNIERLEEKYSVTIPMIDESKDEITDLIVNTLNKHPSASFVNITLSFARINDDGSITDRRDRAIGFKSDWLANMNEIDDILSYVISEYFDSHMIEITFEFIFPKAGGLVRVGMFKKGEMFTTYNDQTVFNPNTKINCAVYCIVGALNPKYIFDLYHRDPKVKNNFSQAVKRFKTQLKIKMKETISHSEIKRIAETKKIHIKIIGDANLDFGDLEKEPITLIQNVDHVMLLVDFLDLPPTENDPVKDVGQFYSKRKTHDEMDLKFFCADLETFSHDDGRQIPYHAGFAYYQQNDLDKNISDLTPTIVNFKGLDCLDNFFKALIEHTHNNQTNSQVVFFHNGGKFDIDVILDRYILDHPEYEIVGTPLFNNGRIMKIIIKLSYDTNVTFLDSICFLNNSLGNLTGKKGFPVIHHKQEFDHKLVNSTTWSEIETNKYFEHDLLGLLEVMDIFSKVIFNKFQIDITKCVSAASVGKMILKTKYFDNKIYIPTKNEDSYIRKAYHGGRTESFYCGKIQGPIYYRDFTSLYPAVACLPMPYGEMRKMDSTKFDLETETGRSRFIGWSLGFTGVHRCLIRTKNFKVKPLISSEHNGKLVFAHFKKWREVYVTTSEIVCGIKHDLYQFRILDGLYQPTKPFLENIHRDLFILKDQAKQDGNEGGSNTFKILLNSVYGTFGMSLYDRTKTVLKKMSEVNDSFLISRMFDGTLNLFKEIGQYYLMNIRSDERCESSVSVAAAITSTARCWLWELMFDIEQNGGKIFYCDTDSIFTDFDLSGCQQLIDKWSPDGGKSLGSLKDELDGGHLTSMTIISPKCYSYTTSDGKITRKFKGVPESKRSCDMYEQLLLGSLPDQYKTVFFRDRMTIRDYGIRIEETRYNIDGKYTKGNVDKYGNVTPFII